MLHGNTHVKLDWIKVDSNQNMLRFHGLMERLCFFALQKFIVPKPKNFIQFNHIFDTWTIESQVTLGNLPTFAFGSRHSYTYDKPIE
jgi:hypothetical protein